MTTKELIEHLSKLPQDEEVFLYVDGNILEIACAPVFSSEDFDVVGNCIIAE